MTEQVKLLHFVDALRVLIHSRPAVVFPGIGEEAAADFPNCTDKPLPENVPAGHVLQLGEGEIREADWVVVEDHRGVAVWSKVTAERMQVVAVGPLAPELTTQEPPASASWSAAAEGWVFDPEKYRPRRMAVIERAYDECLARGFVYAGKLIQADLASQAKITGAVTMALLAVQAGVEYSIEWTCADNSVLVLSAAEMMAMGQACGQFVRDCFYNRRQLKDAVRAADTAAGIDAVDAAAGWPVEEE